MDVNVDLDRTTGATLQGWPVVAQAVSELVVTAFGERIMREWVGSPVPRALGRALNEETALVLVAAMAAVVDVFEPRFKVVRCAPVALTRTGQLRLEMEGEYRPRALLGDPTAQGLRRVVVGP